MKKRVGSKISPENLAVILFVSVILIVAIFIVFNTPRERAVAGKAVGDSCVSIINCGAGEICVSGICQASASENTPPSLEIYYPIDSSSTRVLPSLPGQPQTTVYDVSNSGLTHDAILYTGLLTREEGVSFPIGAAEFQNGGELRANYQSPDDFTLSFWAKFPSVSGNEVLFRWGDQNNVRFAELRRGGGRLILYADGADRFATGNGFLEGDRWYHFSLVQGITRGSPNSVTYAFYIDGNLVSTYLNSASLPANLNNAQMIEFGDVDSTDGQGTLIDEVKVYIGALNPTEVFNQLYKLTDTLTLRYSLDSNTLSSTVVQDLSAFDNDGGLQGSPSTSVGIDNEGLVFDGFDDSIEVQDDDSLDFTGSEEFTISLWVKADPSQKDTTASVNSILEKWEDGTDPYPYVLRMSNTGSNKGKVTAARYDGINAVSVISSAVVDDGNWHHIAIVKDSKFRLYLDGREEGSAIDSALGSTLNDDNLHIGRRGDRDDTTGTRRRFYFTGEIDEVEIFDRSFANFEVRDLLYKQHSICGNNQVEITEVCDDGNSLNGDGCSAVCQWEVFCGNGNVDAGETCDDGGTVSGDGCDTICRSEICGDGRLNVGEQCDDGNTNDGDGCSAICESEFSGVCGDVAGNDGLINIQDVLTIVNNIIGVTPLSVPSNIADINNDGLVDVRDIILIISEIINPTGNLRCAANP